MTRRPALSEYLTLGLCALIFSCTLTYPFNNDNALYAYMADLALHGRMPYVGSWDQNFPAIVAVHAVQILLTGHSQLAFHLFDIALQLVGSFLLLRIGTALYSRRAGMLAAVLAALYYVQAGFWMAGERDTYVSILLLAAYLFSLTKRQHITIGLLCGCAFLFRPTYALYVPVFVVGSYMQFQNWRDALRVLLGSLLPVIAVVLFYLAIGGLGDLYDATIRFNLEIYGGIGAQFSFWQPIRFYAISVIAVAVGASQLWKRERSRLVVLSLLFASSVVSLLALYRHSIYHYHPAMTMFLLLSAVGWQWLADKATQYRRVFSFLVPAVVVTFFAYQTLRGNTIRNVLRGMITGNIRTLANSYTAYEQSPDFGVAMQTQVGEYLRTHAPRSGAVQMFGPYSFPQYLAGLLTASRFQTLHAITMRGADGSLRPFQEKWRAEYLRDLNRVKPVYFIVCDAPEAFRQYYGGRLGHEILHDDFTALGAWVNLHYSAETKIGAFTLYRWRG